jgi:hypothetical protein
MKDFRRHVHISTEWDSELQGASLAAVRDDARREMRRAG